MKIIAAMLLVVAVRAHAGPIPAAARRSDPAPERLCQSAAAGNPYFRVPYVTPGAKVYLSQGILLTPRMAYSQAWTNVAAVYHPLSAGSIIPTDLQPYLPPEAWSVNLGAGYASADRSEAVGPGLSVNLLDSTRAYASTILGKSNNATLAAIAHQIAPGDGPLNITFGPQWATPLIRNGVVIPPNEWRLKPFWYGGASYGF